MNGLILFYSKLLSYDLRENSDDFVRSYAPLSSIIFPANYGAAENMAGSSPANIYLSKFLSSCIVSIDTRKLFSFDLKISTIIGAIWIGMKGDL